MFASLFEPSLYPLLGPASKRPRTVPAFASSRIIHNEQPFIPDRFSVLSLATRAHRDRQRALLSLFFRGVHVQIDQTAG